MPDEVNDCLHHVTRLTNNQYLESMRLSFTIVATASAALCLSLALTWSLAPHLLLALWGVDFSPSAAFVARRNAALFLGIAVMLFLARDAEPSVARNAIAAGVSIACLCLAALGLFELFGGNAGPGILSAVITEVGIAVAFIRVTF